MEIHSTTSSRSRRKTFTVPHPPQVQGDICNRTFVSSGDCPPPVHGNKDRPHPILKESIRGNCGGSSSFSFSTAHNGNAPTTVTILPSGPSLEPHSSLTDSFLSQLHNSFLNDADVRRRNEQRNSIFEDLEGTLDKSREKLQSIGINYSDSEDLLSSTLETSTESEDKFFEVSVVEPRRKHKKSNNNTKLDMLRLEEKHLKEDLDSVNTQINFLNVQKRTERKKLNHEIQDMVSRYDDTKRRIEEIKADIQKVEQETQRLEGMRKDARGNLEIRAEFPRILFKFEDQWACLDKDFCHEFCKEATNRCENVHRGNPAPNL